MSWRDEAACNGRDTNLFFDRYAPGGIAAARALCEECKVRSACLAFAFTTKSEDGIFGGFDPEQRKQLSKRLAGESPILRQEITQAWFACPPKQSWPIYRPNTIGSRATDDLN